MRIPVSLADLESGRFSKSSRALRKAWPGGQIGLMQAQNELASFLGYRDLHDLQRSTAAAIPTDVAYSRPEIRNAVAWQMWRKRGIPLAAAAQIAAKLHLEHLDIDQETAEAQMQRTLMSFPSAPGVQVVIDEAWQLLEAGYDPKTPALIDAGAPPFQYAVLADERVFVWRDLVSVVNKLPNDYLASLKEEGRYAGVHDDAAIERRFIAEGLLPMAHTTLSDATKSHQVLPEGFRIEWIFDEAASCVGRVITNEALGGIIPTIFGTDDAIFAALGDLLVGRHIPSEAGDLESAAGEGRPVWTMRHSRGYEIEPYLRNADGSIRKEQLKALPKTIRLVPCAGGELVLSGPTFAEAGQLYVRNRAWCGREDVPTEVLGGSERGGDPDLYPKSRAAIPAAAEEFHQAAWAEIRERATRALAVLRAPTAIQRMARLAADAFPVEAFDTYCKAAIDACLPLRYEGETVDNPSLLEDRAEELRHLGWLGGEIKTALPEFAAYAPTSLGLVMLFSEAEYPGSRHSGLVSPPSSADKKTDATRKAEFAAFFLLGAACVAAGENIPEEKVPGEVMAIVAEGVLSGPLSLTTMPGAWRSMAKFHQLLQDQAAFLKRVAEWRAAQDALASLRMGGQYLATGAPVPRERPMSLTDHHFRANRKFTVVAQQTLADLQKRGDARAT